MPVIQSLICWIGCDNRNRFSFIMIASHLFFIFMVVLFPSSTLFQLIACLISLTALVCTTKRRLTDSKLTNHWLMVPSSAFILTALIIIIFNNTALYWLMMFSIAIAAVLLTYPSQTKRHYIWGYAGPVNLKKQANIRRHRIEPKLQSLAIEPKFDHLDTIDNYNSLDNIDAHSTSYKNSIDVGEKIRQYLLSKTNPRNAISAILILVVVITLAVLITQKTTKTDTALIALKASSEQALAPLDTTRHNSLAMPDNFMLFTNSYDGLIINWQADSTDKNTLWNIRKAQGDDSCQYIQFNNDDKHRTTRVTVEHNDDYFAEFSPVDTKKLLNGLAARGSFKLCGYSFSLKGSQATLGKHNYYNEKLSN